MGGTCFLLYWTKERALEGGESNLIIWYFVFNRIELSTGDHISGFGMFVGLNL